MEFLTPGRINLAINAEAILHLVENHYGYAHGTLKRKSNARDYSHPRHVVAYLLLRYGMSSVATAKFLGKNHATVLHSRAVVQKAFGEDESVTEFVKLLESEIDSDKERFRVKRTSLLSVIKPRVSAKEPLSIANGLIHGTEDLDALIRSGKGDIPRVKIEDFNRARNQQA